MKLTIFHAGDGDCLLLSSADDPPRHVLVDGGRKGSYDDHARGFLGRMASAGETLDLVCVSHIDDDHISGILRLVEDEVEWRAFEFLQTIADDPASPDVPRPPSIGEVWHNGLFHLVGDELAPAVEGMLEAVATVLAGSPDEAVRELASHFDDLATGERSSMELSRRLSAEQLGIPVNPRADGPLVKRGTVDAPVAGEDVTLGGLRLLLLGPSGDDLLALRSEWEEWIAENRHQLRRLQEEMLEDEERLGTLAPRAVANPLGTGLGEGLSGVTEPNLASVMLLVEEGDASVLLTGDGVSAEVLEGLARHGRLDDEGRIHVGVLKVQHHGALANVTDRFVQRVSADHYVFCGNGAHDNPEMEVVEAFAKARLEGWKGDPPLRPEEPFTFWFSSHEETPGLTDARRAHMKAIESLVADLREGHEDEMREARWVRDEPLELEP